LECGGSTPLSFFSWLRLAFFCFPARCYDAAMRHFPIRECGYALRFVVLLAVLYVGAYYAMIDLHLHAYEMKTDVLIGGSLTPAQIQPIYRIRGDWIAGFFESWHEIDRRLRPAYWTR
jgi:hypothetical protein